LSVTHYNNELGEVVEYEMLDPQSLAEMTPLLFITAFIEKKINTPMSMALVRALAYMVA